MSNVGDYEDMAKHAQFILENDARLAEFKKNAYAHAQTFSIENILPRYEEFYERTLHINDIEFMI